MAVSLTALAMQGVTAQPDISEVTETEHLNTEIPVGWVQTVDSATANLRVSEYLPDKSPDPWQQKLSIEAMTGDPLPDPLEFVDGWARQQAQLCDRFGDHPIHSGFENGYPTIVRMLVCGENKRTQKPLVTLIKVIRGNQSLYTITRIWRLDTLPLENTEIAAWSTSLSKTFVCDPPLPAHPC